MGERDVVPAVLPDGESRSVLWLDGEVAVRTRWHALVTIRQELLRSAP